MKKSTCFLLLTVVIICAISYFSRVVSSHVRVRIDTGLTVDEIEAAKSNLTGEESAEELIQLARELRWQAKNQN